MGRSVALIATLLLAATSSSHAARPSLARRPSSAGARASAAKLSSTAPASAGGVPRETALAIAAGVLGALQFGYAIGVVNAPQDVICSALGISSSPARWATIVGVFGPAGLVGAQAAGKLVSQLGARAVLCRISWVFLAGGVFQWLAGGGRAHAFWLLLLGRALVGLGSGLATVAVPVFLGECSSVELRGAFGNLNQFAVVIGILAAQLLGLSLATPTGWRWLMGAPALIALVQLASSPLLVDSAARLVSRGQKAEARALLVRIRPVGTPSAKIEAELASLSADASATQAGAATSALQAARSSPAIAKALRLSLLLMVAQQLSGVNAVFFYSTAIFKAAGLANPAIGTLVCGVVNVLATGLAVWLIEKAGRRPLVLTGMGGMGACALLLTLLLVAGPAAPASACLSIVCLSICFFEIGLGGIPWAIGNELFPPSCRASAMALCAAANWLATTFIALAFPLMQRSLGAYSFLPFAGVLAVSFALTHATLPETKGRTIKQIQETLGAQ